MLVIGRMAVTAGAVSTVLLCGAGVAWAGAKTPLSAGYTISAPVGTVVDTTFTVPVVDCGAAPNSSLFVGAAFHGATTAMTNDATAGVIATCTDGTASYLVGVGYGDVTAPFVYRSYVAPGDEVEVTLQDSGVGNVALGAGWHSDSESFEANAYVYESDTATLSQGGSTRGVLGSSPSFAPVAFSSTVDNAPLANASLIKARQAGGSGLNTLSVSPLRSTTFKLRYRHSG